MNVPMRSTSISPPAQASPRRRPAWLRPGVRWFAFDLLAPTALLYVMLWLGTSLYVALLASATLSAVSALVSYRRGTGGQRFAPHMLAMTLASFAIALVTGSDRFLLAKESVLTAMMGLWFFLSIWSERPLTYLFTRPLLERRSVMPFETLWEQEPHFRHIWRMSSLLWTIALLIDAVLRVVMAYTLPINAVPALQTALMLVTALIMQPVSWVYYYRSGLWAMIFHGSRRERPGSEDR